MIFNFNFIYIEYVDATCTIREVLGEVYHALGNRHV